MPDLSEAVDQHSILRGHLAHQTILFDPHATAPIYIGWADPGTAASAATWRIARLTYSGADITKLEWADGNNLYDNIWNNRATVNYS